MRALVEFKETMGLQYAAVETFTPYKTYNTFRILCVNTDKCKRNVHKQGAPIVAVNSHTI